MAHFFQGQGAEQPANPSDPNTPNAPVEQAAQSGDGGNQNFDPAPVQREESTLNTDDDGNLIDPPTITSYERQIAEAANEGDQDRINLIQEEYDSKRVELAQRRADREQEGN